MKYQYVIDNPENSHGKILSHISPGSKILECGCATGYMTQYMAEQLNCHVSIIEYEKEAYDIARQYAEDGICCDLTGNDWYHYFKKRGFDVILFADVLEHLTCPDRVLRRAVELLRDDGMILISIPNVAHNDIIIKLLQNRWDYTDIGLLDDTHVHFWGANNLDAFAENAGMKIVCMEGVIVPTFTSEQLAERKLSNDDYRLLQKRQYGEVYQFVLTLQKEEYVVQNNIPLDNRLPQKPGFELVYDTDNQKVATLYLTEVPGAYADAKKMYFAYVVDDAISIHFETAIGDSVQELRFDPSERKCIVSSLQVFCSGRPLDCKLANCSSHDGIFVFQTEDPQFIFDLPTGTERKITIDCTVVLGCDMLKWAEQKIQQVRDYDHVHSEYNAELDSLKIVNRGHEVHIRQLEAANGAKEDHIRELERANGAKEDHIRELEKANGAKEDHIRELEKANGAKADHIRELEAENAAKIEEILKLKREIEQLN